MSELAWAVTLIIGAAVVNIAGAGLNFHQTRQNKLMSDLLADGYRSRRNEPHTVRDAPPDDAR